MKLFVTGADGMVGSYVGEVFGDESVYKTTHTSMDVTDYRAVERSIGEIRPDVVLHLAAATNVDRCETQVDEAYRVNVLGTENVALVCQKFDALLVSLSSTGIFDGLKHEPYTEFDSPNPLTVYHTTKWEGEKVVRDRMKRYFIIRAGWMIGGGKDDKKFVAKIVEQCQQGNAIKAVDDKIGSPTYAKHLLQTIRQLLQTPHYGLYHVVNQGVCSRYDVAREVVKILGSSVRVDPVASTAFPLPARRPRSEAAINYKLQLMGMDSMPPWQVALKDYLGEWMHKS